MTDTFVSTKTNNPNMKKSTIILILIAFTISSCSIYTCPTYAKKEVKEMKKFEKNTRI